MPGLCVFAGSEKNLLVDKSLGTGPVIYPVDPWEFISSYRSCLSGGLVLVSSPVCVGASLTHPVRSELLPPSCFSLHFSTDQLQSSVEQ